MKNLEFFICSMSSGGAEHQLSLLTNFLSNKNYNIKITTFADIPDHYLLNPKIKRIKLGENTNPFVKFYQIFKYFLQNKDSVIISFGHRESTLIILPLLLNRKLTFIAGERNLDLKKYSIKERIISSLIFKRAKYVIPNSFSQKLFLDKYINNDNKLKVITNYTNPDEFIYQTPPCNKRIIIGIFARYSSQKNYKRFAYAIKIVKEKCDVDFLVKWHGSIHRHNNICPEYLEFKEMIQKLEISDQIELHNHVQDVISVMKDYDAICLPSLHEGFSNAISEAICCGKPMLVSDVSDNSVMVHDGENGFLFNPYSEEDIANALIRFLNLNQEKRMLMGKRSREIALNLFDEDKFINDYIQIIES